MVYSCYNYSYSRINWYWNWISTEILKYNINDICNFFISRLDNKPPPEDIAPWYRGFKGLIIKEGKNKYRSKGVFEIYASQYMIKK